MNFTFRDSLLVPKITKCGDLLYTTFYQMGCTSIHIGTTNWHSSTQPRDKRTHTTQGREYPDAIARDLKQDTDNHTKLRRDYHHSPTLQHYTTGQYHSTSTIRTKGKHRQGSKQIWGPTHPLNTRNLVRQPFMLQPAEHAIGPYTNSLQWENPITQDTRLDRAIITNKMTKETHKRGTTIQNGHYSKLQTHKVSTTSTRTPTAN